MPGKEIRTSRLFNENKNAVIVAIDHGEFDGPIPGMINIKETIKKINPEVDAILMSPGTLKLCGDTFSKRNSPLAVVRINWATVYCFHWNYNQGDTVQAVSVDEAVALGADIVLISLTLKTGSETIDARNVELFCKMASRAHQLGIPVIGEFFPTHSDTLTQVEMHVQVKTGSRILAELGADMIKTFSTYKFTEVVEGCPIPILGLGGSKTNTQLEALKLAYDEVKDGAKGVVFGRNAIQVENPHKFQSALCEVVKDFADPLKVVKKYALE